MYQSFDFSLGAIGADSCRFVPFGRYRKFVVV
jgi:hypothetical protein